MGVGLVMALLCGTAWIAVRKRSGLPLFGRNPLERMASRRLILMERLVLTPHHALHLVCAEGRTLVVATHPQGVAFAAAADDAAAFRQLFTAAAGQPGGCELPGGAGR